MYIYMYIILIVIIIALGIGVRIFFSHRCTDTPRDKNPCATAVLIKHGLYN